MTSTNLILDLEFSTSNGSMTVEIFAGSQSIAVYQDVPPGCVRLHHAIELPTQLRFEISNKNYDLDTRVDQQGHITADKFVKLQHVRLGNIPIKSEILYRICRYQNDRSDQIQFDPMWCFNGTATIDFFDQNFIRYLLMIDNKFSHK